MDYIDPFGGLAAIFGHCSLGSAGRSAPSVGTNPPAGGGLTSVPVDRVPIDPGSYTGGGPIRIAIQGLGNFEGSSGPAIQNTSTSSFGVFEE